MQKLIKIPQTVLALMGFLLISLSFASAASASFWSSHWFSEAQHWDEHLARSCNANTWAARLREYHGKQWLIDNWAQLAPPGSSVVSMLAGRTGTNALRGKVQMRWHDVIDFERGMTVSQSEPWYNM